VKWEFLRLAEAAVEHWEQDGGQDEKGKPRPTARKVTTRVVADVMQALGGETIVPSSLAPPCWLPDPDAGPEPFPAGETLACANGLLHLPSCATGPPRLVPHTPRFLSFNALAYNFDPLAPAPGQWQSFLSEDLWPKDPQSVETLQDWFGYCLAPDTSLQKILAIIGPPRSGKGTIARVLRALVGIDNTAGPTLAGLGTNFGLSPLLGKTLAVISDARLSGRTDAAVVTERLLSVSGEDAQTIDRKNMSHVTCQLPVRFMILTNELPGLNDPSGALVGRLIVLRQTRSWYGKEDSKLTGRLLTELPGILL
jgi:putative DNA primase/helicase